MKSMKSKVLTAIQSHFKMFSRAISAAELKDAVQTETGFDWSLQCFKEAIDQLLQEEKIEISGAKMYKPYGAVVNEDPLPTAGEITPHPARHVWAKDVSESLEECNNANKKDVGGVK